MRITWLLRQTTNPPGCDRRAPVLYYPSPRCCRAPWPLPRVLADREAFPFSALGSIVPPNEGIGQARFSGAKHVKSGDSRCPIQCEQHRLSSQSRAPIE